MEADQQNKKHTKILGHDPFADVSDQEWVDNTAVSESSAQIDDAFSTLEAELLGDPAALLDDIFNLPESDDSNAAQPDETAVQFPPEDGDFLDSLITTIDNEIDALYSGVDLRRAETETAASTGQEQYIIFALDRVEYAVSITNIMEIGRPLEITWMPNVPEWLLGVANLRGDIISVVDLRTFLGLPRNEFQENGRLLVTQSHNEDMTVGLIVDRVTGLGSLQTGRIGAPTAPIEDQVAPYLRGVYEHEGRLLVVLNLDKLLLSAEMQQFEPL